MLRGNIESNDHEEFTSLIKVADIEEIVLEPESFQGKARLVITDHVILCNFQINKKVFQIGSATPGYVTFTIWHPNTLFN
jgi:hypothetical protein